MMYTHTLTLTLSLHHQLGHKIHQNSLSPSFTHSTRADPRARVKLFHREMTPPLLYSALTLTTKLLSQLSFNLHLTPPASTCTQFYSICLHCCLTCFYFHSTFLPPSTARTLFSTLHVFSPSSCMPISYSTSSPSHTFHLHSSNLSI